MAIHAAQFDFGGGPDMKGSWKNYHTGEVINIRDTIIEDNQVIGVSTDGQQVPYSRLQSFVKLDRPEPNTRPQPQQRSTTAKRPTSPRPTTTTPTSMIVDESEIDTSGYEILPEDMALMGDPLHAKPSQQQRNAPEHTPFQVTKTPAIDPSIEKVLDGLAKKECPRVTVDVKWDSIPEGILFLKKYLNIEEEDLVKACLIKFIDMDDIKVKLQMQLAKLVENGLNPKPKEPTKKEPSKKEKITKE